MSDVPELEDLMAGFRRLLAAEYQRGQDDATKRIIAAATSGQKSAATNGQQHARNERSDSTVEAKRQRVPHGAPDALITRVLTACGLAGATPQDIQQAQSSDEFEVSYSGIRFALDRGKKKNRYRNQGGRWYLTERR
jgi:hypothetical protein